MHNGGFMHPFPIMNNIIPAVGALIVSTSGNTALVVSHNKDSDGAIYSVVVQWCNKDKPTYLDVPGFNLMVKMKKWEYVTS